MQYLFSIILTIISYLFGVYFSTQGLRSVIDRPLIYSFGILSEVILFILNLLFGWVLAFVSLYVAYKSSGILFAVIISIIRFIILPMLFNDKIQNFMKKNGF